MVKTKLPPGPRFRFLIALFYLLFIYYKNRTRGPYNNYYYYYYYTPKL